MIIGITLQLFIDATPRSNMSGITACWWDSTDPSQIASPAGKTVGASTDATGTLSLDLSSVSALSVGAPGFLLLYLPDAQSPQEALVFAGVVETSEVVSGIPLGYIAESDASASAAIAVHQAMLAQVAAESTAQDKAQTALDRAATADDRLATAADRLQTGADAESAKTAAESAALSRDSADESAAQAEASATAAADASRLTVGTVTTAPAGSSAEATISGPPGAQVLDLTLPAGADGAPGPQGPQGPQGDVGDVNPQMPLILAAAAAAAPVQSVFGRTGTVTLQSTDVTGALGFTPLDAAQKSAANGIAPLGSDSKVPAAYLPSYVDDVLEYANTAGFPAIGEAAKIYVALDTNKTYRWAGSAYVEISPSPGTTDSLTEGATNLYFTTARARASLSATGAVSYNAATGVISAELTSGYVSKTISANTTLNADTEYETGRNLRVNHGIRLTVPNTTLLIVRKYAAGSSL